jgi:hypothetical protein
VNTDNALSRVKDAKFTDPVRHPADQDQIFNSEHAPIADPWGMASPSASGGEFIHIQNVQIAHLQGMLPSREQVSRIFEYHREWLLWLHGSWYAPTVARDIEAFYVNDHGMIHSTSIKLQWSALLFAILSSTMASAKSKHVVLWDILERDQTLLAKQWYQAATDCLSISQYQQNHNIYGIQAIGTLTTCAHILGFSPTQSVLLASAQRIAQSLNLHRLRGEYKVPRNDQDVEEHVRRETGRLMWQHLVIQDWFSVPFSETYSLNPMHFTSTKPLNCDEQTLDLLPSSTPTMVTFVNFMWDSKHFP